MTGDSTVPIRMDALAVLPVFFKLAGKRAVMAGGTLPAVWKAELLSACGADVEIYADAPCPDLVDLATTPPGGAIRLHPRSWQPEDLAGAAIAIGAIDADDEAEAFASAARAAGVPVNVIDKPAFCDFQFGTIVSRSPLVIGISTDGAAPVFGQAVRARIEALLPQGLKRWAEAARDWRPALQAKRLEFRARRRFWEVFTKQAFAEPDRAPQSQDRDAALAEALRETRPDEPCRIALVGTGPGNADAVTLGAIRALQAADIVVHAATVAPEIVGFARREAIKIGVPPSGDRLPQSLGDLVRPGVRIAWLDRGDPTVCLRWRARADALGDLPATLSQEAGLGACENCRSSCPAWGLSNKSATTVTPQP